MSDDHDSESEHQESAINFHYLKSAEFRTYHVDGAFGGIAPSGKYIHMSIYTERHPLPRQITHVVEGNSVGAEIDRVTRDGIIRELQADLVFGKETAITMVEWLQGKLGQLAELESKSHKEAQ